MVCNNTVKVFIGLFRSVKYVCGSIGHEGQLVQCPECEEASKKAYPQGWVSTPGDICKHGTYIGDWSTRDYICVQCEFGDNEQSVKGGEGRWKIS